MFRKTRRPRGLTLAEVLFFAVLIPLTVIFAVTMLRRAQMRARTARCKGRLSILYKGLRMYLNNYDEFFPPAWHVGGSAAAADLGNVAYHRFLLHEHADSAFNHLVRAPGGTAADKFLETAQFWADPQTGWTNDYFAPEDVLGLPPQQGKPFRRPSQYVDLVRNVSSTDRPLFTEVNASVPHPKASVRANGGETRNGVPGRWTNVFGVNVFFGVAESLRKTSDPSTTRFDFRHGGRVNVMFLDSHVESIAEDDRARLAKIHRYWNSLTGKEAAE